MVIRRLKTKIGFNVAVLTLLSAIITDVLVITVVQNVWVREKIEIDYHYLQSLGQLFFIDYDNKKAIEGKKVILSTFMDNYQIQSLCIMDTSKILFWGSTNKSFATELITDNLRKALKTNERQKKDIGLVYSGFWWHPQSILISVPIHDEDNMPIGGIGAVISLMPIYQKLSQYNKAVLFYILLNTAFLSVVGLYRIFRFYLHPIDRIIDQANSYHDDTNPFFVFRREDRELNRLSSALNQMLQKIADDKEKLKNTVACLEKTNEELKREQNKVIRAEKMASVGRLASGIAHEIGNPIGIILGYLDLLAQSDLTENERKDFLYRANTEIQRINTIIRQLLDFARSKGSAPHNVSIHAILDDLVTMMRMQPMVHGIEIHCGFDASNDVIRTDSDQLRQVFLNLILNSVDAIKSDTAISQGRVEIRTADLPTISGGTEDYVEVIIEDNGPGISNKDMGFIFDPFFTTKEPGKGTGLGLAVSYTMIEQMGGSISVQSPEGKGAVFRVVLSRSGCKAEKE